MYEALSSLPPTQKSVTSHIYEALRSLPPAHKPVTSPYMKHYVHYRLKTSLSLVHIWSTTFVTVWTEACHCFIYEALCSLPPAQKPVPGPYMKHYVHCRLHVRMSLFQIWISTFITACTEVWIWSIYEALHSFLPALKSVTGSYMKHNVHYRLLGNLSLVHIWSISFIPGSKDICHWFIYEALRSLPLAQYPVSGPYMKRYLNYRLHKILSLLHIWSTTYNTAFTKACHSSIYEVLLSIPLSRNPVTAPFMKH